MDHRNVFSDTKVSEFEFGFAQSAEFLFRVGPCAEFEIDFEFTVRLEKEFEVTVSYEKLSWSSSLSNVRISHNKVENKSEITTDEIAISDDKGNVFIQQFKLNRRFDGVLTTWSHISVQSSVESLDCINIVRLKYLDIYQGIYKRRTYIEDTTLAIEISGNLL